MTTTQFPIAQRQIGPAGVSSAGQNIPAGLVSIKAQIASTDWFTTTGTVTWSIDRLVNGVWDVAVGNTLTMGSTFKGDGSTMPSIGCDASTLANATQVRISASCSPRISLGGTITVVTNP